MRAIGIDVGGTNVRVAVVADTGDVVTQRRASTPKEAEALAEIIGELVGEHDDGLPVGMGLAGGVDRDGTLVLGPNLGMEGAQVRAPLEEAVGRGIVIANDASVAAWAEHKVGAGRGHQNVLLVTIGTGVGGGAVVAGHLLVGSHGLGGEFGHIVIEDGGRACSCGNRGCLEAYAAGRRFGMGDRHAGEVAAAALAGDDEAVAHVAEVGRRLGVGVSSLVNAFDPGVVLIGGGAGQGAFDAIVGPVRDTLASLLIGRGRRRPPRVAKAALGDDAGVVGAALLAIEHADGTGAHETRL